jgi:hypothetical protein
MNKYGWGMSWLIRSDSKGTRASGPRTLPGPLAPRDRGAHKLISPSGPGVARVSNPSEGVRDISAEDEPKRNGGVPPPFRSMPARSSIGMGRSRSRAASDSPHRTDSDRIRASP